MKIFGIGLSRTGTTALNDLLVYLGYHVIHYPQHNQMFDATNHGGTDIPITANYKLLDRVFPGSKFVYTVRDKEQWLDSIVPYFERKRTWRMNEYTTTIRQSVYKSLFPTREEASAAWDRHDADVKEYFKDRPDDLLIINIVNGDDPKALYDFLNLDRPNLPEQFPHSNKLTK